jgi:ATP-dependent DNA ligase
LAVIGPAPAFIGDDAPVEAPRELLEAIGAVADCAAGVLDGVIVRGLADESDLEMDAQGEAFQRPSMLRDVYVAFDLLEVDGTSLLDTPLLERKRHLAGVLRPSPNVRISPFVRRGMRAWRDTLVGQGFKQVIAKRVNSRYHAGTTNPDWLRIEKL